MDVRETVRSFYNHNAQYEWERLERHPIEFEVTRHFLDRYINPGDRVLDIGGGPGRYSLYLAEKGCDVTLLDLSDANVQFAREEAARRGLALKAVQGDACAADQAVSGSYDHVLLMGPMYHLLEESLRGEAVSAALRLLRPAGVLFVSFISLYAGFSYYMKEMPEGVLEPSEQDYIQCYLDGRTYCGDAFTKACFIAPKEIEPFMAGFDLEQLHLFGQEGVTSPAEDRILASGGEAVQRWIDISIQKCESRELMAYSEHLMYVGRRKSDLRMRPPVRRITAEDLPECHSVVRQSFATVADEFGLTEQNCPTHTSFIRLETLQNHFAGGDWMIGYWMEGRIVGFAAIHNKGGGVYELQNLAVLPSHRRAGYGRDLLSCAVEIVGRLGGEKLTIGIIEDNTKLKNWYARNGFLHTGTKRFSHLPFTVGFMEYPISR